MKTAYLDTNIIISLLKPTDPFYTSSKIILQSPFVKNIISTLTLVEIKSVISRQLGELLENLSDKIKDLIKNLSDEETVELIYHYLLESITFEIHENLAIQESSISVYKGKIFSVYSLALQLSNITKLRTLDNLQLAHSLQIHQESNEKIDYFVTGDLNFLNQIDVIRNKFPFTILAPDKLLNLEKS